MPNPTDPMQEPGAYLIDGSLFFRMPDRSTILCTCIGEPFSRMIVEMWNAKQQSRPMSDAVRNFVLPNGLPPDWHLRCKSGEELT